MPDPYPAGWLSHLRERGVVRVAASYAVIAWLVLQIADVTLEPLGAPTWAMTALIVAAALGFPVALALAWFLEVGADGVHVDHAPAGAARPQARGLRHYADAIVIGVLLVAVAVLLVRQSDLGKPKPPENPAIAVLPFENLSGDPEQEYFSDGLAEEMLDRLGRVPGLKVIARSSSFGFKGKDVDAKTIAERLGVTTLLEGSVRRDGKRLKLSARLIDGATGQQLWSGSFDRELTDLFAVQAELAGAVVSAIVPAAKGSPVESPVSPTTDLDAYDLYLAARTQLAIRTEESIRKSVDLSEQAVRLDPQFARGQAQLANSLVFQAAWTEESDRDLSAALLRRAETVVHKALALDPDLSEAHGAYANLLRNTNRPGAEEQYRLALDLNPNNATAWHDYSVYLGNTANRPEETRRATERALELDPRQPVTWANYLDRAVRMVGDMPSAIDRFTLPALSTPGFPVEVMKAAAIKQRTPHVENIPLWLNRFRAWLAVDPGRARLSLPAEANLVRPSGADLESIRLFLATDIAGILGDWTSVGQTLDLLRARPWPNKQRVASVAAFWLTVQGREHEAAVELEQAGEIPADWIPPVLGGDATYGLMETAQIRILRATGRKEHADRIAAELLERMRADRRQVGNGCTLRSRSFDGWLRYASLAANEGLRDEAVDAIGGAMRCGELPPSFQPQLPWFSALDGYPPYEELKRERLRRIERIRPELMSLETEAGFVQEPPAAR
jgi:TolB-like protein/tetratricopeptide (TPR) repeat protein